MHRSWIVARKELLDTFRDPRTLLFTLFLPLVLYPAIFLAMGLVLEANRAREEGAALRVAVRVEDAAAAPGLAAALAASRHLELVQVAFGPEAVRDRIVDAAVRLTGPPGVRSDAPRSGAPDQRIDGLGGISIYYDETDALSRRARVEIETAVSRYRDEMVRSEITRLGGDPRLLDRTPVEFANVASARDMGSHILGAVVPYLLVILIASAASHTAVDMTAGEKERSTLETILISGVGRGELLLGKFLATLATAAAAGVVGLIGLVATLVLPGGAAAFEAEGIALPAGSIAVLVAMILPVAALLSAALLVLGCVARSAREGQIYASTLIIVVAVGAVASVASEVEPGAGLYLVPILGTTQVQRELLGGGAEPARVALAVLSPLVLSGFGLWGAVRLFGSERILYKS